MSAAFGRSSAPDDGDMDPLLGGAPAATAAKRSSPADAPPAIAPLLELSLHVASLYVIWMVGFSLYFYYGTDENWTVAEAVYFVANVGMGIGYGAPVLTTAEGKYVASVFSFVGNAFVVSSVIVGSKFITMKLASASALPVARDGAAAAGPGVSSLTPLTRRMIAVWAAVVAGGAMAAKLWFKMDWAGSICFSVTTLTTAGIQAPPDGEAEYVFTTVFALLGVPLTIATWGLLVDRYFRWYERAQMKVELGMGAAASVLVYDQVAAVRAAPGYGAYLEDQLRGNDLVDDETVAMLRWRFHTEHSRTPYERPQPASWREWA